MLSFKGPQLFVNPVAQADTGWIMHPRRWNCASPKVAGLVGRLEA